MTWHPDIPDEYRNQIVTRDARELAKRIPDESVDLIFTDPVYDRMDDYRWLAETAARVLKPDRACLAFCGIGYLPETHDAMRAGGLDYRWRLVIKPVWKLEFHGRLLVGSQECLWYEKGHSKLYQSQLDVQMSTVKGQHGVNGSNWGKSAQDLRRFIEAFTKPGDLVVDFYSGSGTVPAVCKMLQRNYIAFEIDPDTAGLARERVRNTQPPLPLVMPVQGELL
jgi:methylase of polypeptide subunit release factors